MKRRAGLVLGSLLAGASAAGAALADTLGMPTDKAIDLQPAGDDLRRSAAFFHNAVLLPVIIGISLFVLALLVIVVLKFNAKSNPNPRRFTHNTRLEIAWTLVPVLILVFIASFSFPLMFRYHDAPKADLTIKATGNQWYWAYEYPDQKVAEYTSNPLTEEQSQKAGVPYKLAVDNPIVVPVGKTVKVLVSGADVLHAFFIPAFGVQVTAVPGKVNEVWFQTEKVGKYYGECNELCGVNHSFMPIEVDVVDQPTFNAWVAKHATAAPAAAPTPAGATPAAPAAPTTPKAPAAPTTSAAANPSTTSPAKAGAPA